MSNDNLTIALFVASVVWLIVLYYLVKAAVRNGVKEGTSRLVDTVLDIRGVMIPDVDVEEDREAAGDMPPTQTARALGSLERRWDQRQAERERD